MQARRLRYTTAPAPQAGNIPLHHPKTRMDIGLQADSPSVNQAVEILSAIYAGHAATGKVPKSA